MPPRRRGTINFINPGYGVGLIIPAEGGVPRRVINLPDGRVMETDGDRIAFYLEDVDSSAGEPRVGASVPYDEHVSERGLRAVGVVVIA